MCTVGLNNDIHIHVLLKTAHAKLLWGRLSATVETKGEIYSWQNDVLGYSKQGPADFSGLAELMDEASNWLTGPFTPAGVQCAT